MINALAASTLEVAINHYLDLALHQFSDESTPASIQALDGKVVAIELLGLNAQFYLAFNGAVVQVQSHIQGQPDARISGTPLSLLRMGLHDKQQQQHALFAGDVVISGDAELGRQVNALLDDINIDWEELLSRLLGDIVAHEIGSRTQALGGWLRQTLDTLSEDTREYLHEETRMLITRAELDLFLSAVDEVRDDAARLDKKIDRMQQQFNEVCG